jgi:anti-sigma factor ChrR (cupin superfamily)
MKHTHRGDEIIEQASLYALGVLSADEARDFEAHVESGCLVCAAELEPARVVVSALGLAGPPLETPAIIRDKLLAQLAKTTTAPSPPSLMSAVTVRAAEGEWRQLFQGVSVKQLFADKEKGTVTSLYKVAPGAALPSHTHGDFEQCLIIEGDFHLNGEMFGPGDFTCSMAGSVHERSYSEHGALLLIVAGASYNMSPQPAA